MPFRYKRVLLIGATSGIGRAMGDKLIQEGAKVIAVGRRQDRLDAFVKTHGPDKASSVRYDVTDQPGLDSFVTRVVTEYPDLDCVFLNAGSQSPYDLRRPGEIDLDRFHDEMTVNYTSIVNLSLKFLSHLLGKPHETGLIITGSGLSLIPAAHLPVYSASKAALLAFWDSLRAQNAQTNVKFIHLSPPAVQSELHDYMGEEAGRSFGMPLDRFIQEAYPKLNEGLAWAPVGYAFPQLASEYNQMVDSRTKIFDTFSRVVLANSK